MFVSEGNIVAFLLLLGGSFFLIWLCAKRIFQFSDEVQALNETKSKQEKMIADWAAYAKSLNAEIERLRPFEKRVIIAESLAEDEKETRLLYYAAAMEAIKAVKELDSDPADVEAVKKLFA